MTLDIWLIYLAAAAGLSLTPGPNGLLSLNHGVRFGVRRTAFTAAGGGTGSSASAVKAACTACNATHAPAPRRRATRAVHSSRGTHQR